MSRKIIIRLFAVILTVSLCPARELTGVVSSSTEVRVTFTPATIDSSYIVSCSSLPDNLPTGESVRGVDITPLESGYAGAHHFRWFRIRPTSPDRHDTIPLTFRFPRPCLVPDQPCRSDQTALIVPLIKSMRLRKTATLPEHPLQYGIRCEVSEDGVYAISGSELFACGIPIAARDKRYIRLFCRGMEVPVFISGLDRDRLSASDVILFYGEHLRGDNTRFTQYSNTNVYWLTLNGSRPGLRIAETSAAPRIDITRYTDFTLQEEIAATSFLDTLHIEYDNDIRWLGDINVVEDLDDLPQTGSAIDNWYWGFIGDEEKTDIVVSVPSPATGRDDWARIRIAMTGLTSDKNRSPDHSVKILINNETPTPTEMTARWDGQSDFIFTSAPFPAAAFAHGLNTITFLTETGRLDRSALNWIEVIYRRDYRALNNSLRFRTAAVDSSVLRQFTLTGFTTGNIDIWDITTHRKLTDITIDKNIQESAVSFTATFQDSVHFPSRYLAHSTTLRRSCDRLVPDTINKALFSTASPDYIIVTTDTLLPAFQPLADHYALQGMDVLIVDIDDIYNVFSNGIKNPDAIRDMMRYFFVANPDNPPAYLLLGGDTSHDLDKKNRSLNVVPTHLTRIPGWGQSSDDGYFVTVNGADNFPDCAVGRFPVRTPDEAHRTVAKTLACAQNSRTGAWRDDILLLGGVEDVFTHFNDRATIDIIGDNMSITRFDAAVRALVASDRF